MACCPGIRRSRETGHRKCWQNNASPSHPSDVSAERATGTPENSPPLKRVKEKVPGSEIKPEIICAFPLCNYANEIPCLNILSALLTGNSLSNNTAAITTSALEFPPPPHLLSDYFGHHVSGVDVDGADGHDLLPIARRELAYQQGDERVELGHLFLVVLFHGVVVALLQTGKSHADVRRPPDLSAGQRHLSQSQGTQ